MQPNIQTKHQSSRLRWRSWCDRQVPKTLHTVVIAGFLSTNSNSRPRHMLLHCQTQVNLLRRVLSQRHHYLSQSLDISALVVAIVQYCIAFFNRALSSTAFSAIVLTSLLRETSLLRVLHFHSARSLSNTHHFTHASLTSLICTNTRRTYKKIKSFQCAEAGLLNIILIN